MRFEKRELKPYAEPVSVEELKNGQKLTWRLKFVALLDLFQARKVRFTADQLCAGKSAQQVGLATRVKRRARSRSKTAIPSGSCAHRCHRSPSRDCRERSPKGRPTGLV